MSAAPIYKRLAIKSPFQSLSHQDRYYAHHLTRASWLGTRIVLTQVSPESNLIFDLIVELFKGCRGQWKSILDGFEDQHAAERDLKEFLQYAALFLSNMGNYYGMGDQKFVPKVTKDFIMKMTAPFPRAKAIAEQCVSALLSAQPANLGYPSSITQSAYYPTPVTADEVEKVSNFMLRNDIGLENTRPLKSQDGSNENEFFILQASIEKDSQPVAIGTTDTPLSAHVKLVRGDHSHELARVSDALSEAIKFCADTQRRSVLQALKVAFSTGRLEDNKSALRLWVKDLDPNVEHILGFVEQYRDPHGTRAEFHGLTAIQDPEESKALQTLVDMSQKFIATLPWVETTDEYGKNGAFENDVFDPPSFKSIHVLSYASTAIMLGITLPNFDDIKQQVGMKNVMIANRESPLAAKELEKASNAPFIHGSERVKFLKHMNASVRQKIVIHELLGHGTGKLLDETNFDITKPPISPVTSRMITSWYKKGQGYYDTFGEIATGMEECRADCVGIDLICDKDLLAIFGYDDTSAITADDLIYNAYLHMGVLGLEALLSYSPDSKSWGSAHDQGRYAIMKTLLKAGDFMKMDVDFDAAEILVSIDQTQLSTKGRQAVRELSVRLHVYRCTADVDSARACFGDLIEVNDYWLAVRKIVATHQPRREVFVQANTFERDGDIFVKEYDVTAEGCIQSWAERSELLDL